jgi:hypothetical protein
VTAFGRRALWIAAAAALLAGCSDDDDRAPAAATAAVVLPAPLNAAGPIGISLLSLSPDSGTTLGGCGNVVFECAGRVRMSVRLDASGASRAAFVNASLHPQGKVTPCLLAQAHHLDIRAGVPATIELPFIVANECQTPVELTHLVVEARDDQGVVSRQEWDVRYRFEP